MPADTSSVSTTSMNRACSPSTRRFWLCGQPFQGSAKCAGLNPRSSPRSRRLLLWWVRLFNLNAVRTTHSQLVAYPGEILTILSWEPKLLRCIRLTMVLRQAFRHSAGQEDEANIDAASFTTFCQKTPEVTSWIRYCGCVYEVDVPVPTFMDSDVMHVLTREKQVRNGEFVEGEGNRPFSTHSKLHPRPKIVFAYTTVFFPKRNANVNNTWKSGRWAKYDNQDDGIHRIAVDWSRLASC